MFQGESVDTMFKLMRRVTEMRSIPKVGGKVFFPPEKKKHTMSFAGVTTLMEAKENKNKVKGFEGTCVIILSNETRLVLY